MFTPKASIFGVIGIALTVFGFIVSDETTYPVWSKFSGVLIVAGVALTSLSVATKFNPIG